MTWLRVETNEIDSRVMMDLGDACGISAEAAFGFLMRFRGRMGDHQPDGNVQSMTDAAIEKWAGWNGLASAFAEPFRKLFLTNEMILEWRIKQGKLIERAEKERRRKRRGKDAETPRSEVRHVNTSRHVSSSVDQVTGIEEKQTASAELPRNIAEQLTPEGTTALECLMRASRNADALVAEVGMILAGGRGIPGVTGAAVSSALSDFRVNGERPTAMLLRAYVRRATQTAPDGSVKPTNEFAVLAEQQRQKEAAGAR